MAVTLSLHMLVTSWQVKEDRVVQLFSDLSGAEELCDICSNVNQNGIAASRFFEIERCFDSRLRREDGARREESSSRAFSPFEMLPRSVGELPHAVADTDRFLLCVARSETKLVKRKESSEI